jgi:YidC/Oxa1 family membrane protein insertase
MDNPRVLLAIALSFLVMLIWQAWMEDYGPQPEPGEQATVTESPVASDSGEDLPVALDDQPPEGGDEDAAVQLPAGQRVEVVTDMFRAVIDTRGGDLREVDLLHYPQSPEEGSEALRLLEESASQLFIPPRKF